MCRNQASAAHAKLSDLPVPVGDSSMRTAAAVDVDVGVDDNEDDVALVLSVVND
jgi:hypothetical protein